MTSLPRCCLFWIIRYRSCLYCDLGRLLAKYELRKLPVSDGATRGFATAAKLLVSSTTESTVAVTVSK